MFIGKTVSVSSFNYLHLEESKKKMLVNEELLIILRQPQSTGSARPICLATPGLEGITSVSYSNV